MKCLDQTRASRKLPPLLQHLSPNLTAAELPKDRFAYAETMILGVWRDRTRAAVREIAETYPTPFIERIRKTCKKHHVPLLFVAPVFGWLRRPWRTRGWVYVADPGPLPGVVPVGAVEGLASLAVWRALGGVPAAGLLYDDRLKGLEPTVYYPGGRKERVPIGKYGRKV